MKKLKLTADCQNLTLLASAISAALGSTAAQAQDQQPEEVIVTGSRIVRRDFQAPSPIVTVDSQRLENSSTISIESVLNQLPQFVPAQTQFSSGIQTGATASLGIASVDLRGIGTNRTLVLVDGRRAQPANASLVIDVNTIPSAAIERVETITGGASAVYGADALAGVVNFILKKDFEGVDSDLQTGMTSEGDGRETRFSTLLGVNSGDRKSNVMLGVEWYKREAVYQRDRDFYMNGWFDPGSTTTGFVNMAGIAQSGTNPASQAVIDQLFANTVDSKGTPYTPGTVKTNQEIYFNPDGSPFVIAGARGYNGPLGDRSLRIDGYSGLKIIPNGDLGTVFMDGFASTPLTRRSAFGRATHEMTDHMTAFAQLNYANVQVETRGGYPPAITVWSAPIPNDHNRTIPAALQTLLDSRTDPTQPWTLHRGLDFQGPNDPISTTDVYQIMAGVQGDFENRDWTWEAYVSSGKTNVNNRNLNTPSLQRYQALVAQPNWGQGTFPAARFYNQSCTTGLPIFYPATPPSQDCLNSIEPNSIAQTTLTQNVVEAYLQGKLVDMKAGELRFSAGVSNRKNTFLYQPINDDQNITDNPVGLFASNITQGSTEVSELYGELLVPVAKRLNLELGYRYSDYDTKAGSVGTYKTLFDWSATDKVRLRGGYQQATRAPNVAELFQGQTLAVVPFAPSDPCSYTTTATWGNVAGNPDRLKVQQLCQAIIGNTTSRFGVAGTPSADTFARLSPPFFPLEIEIQRGNPDVGPEVAKTVTLGVVFTGPGNLEGLTASVDLYDIKIADAIAPVNSLFVYSKCFNADGSNPTYSIDDPGGYCRLIGRNPTTGERAQVDAPFKNSGVLHTSGIDIAANWRHDMGKGQFFVNNNVTYLDKYDVQDVAGGAIINVKGTFDRGGQFDYKLTSTLGYNWGKSNIGMQFRYLPSIKNQAAARTPDTNIQGSDSYHTFNFFAGHEINEKLSLRGGIDNLTNEQPLIYGARPGDTASYTTQPGYYDVLGRRAYVGIKASF